MAIKIQTLRESISDDGIKIVVYGKAASGKTVLSATICETVFMISAESGLLSLKDVPQEIHDRYQVVTVTQLTDIGEIFAYLIAEKRAEWIILDSVSEIAEVVLADKKSGTKDARSAYGDMADDVLGMIRSFRDIPGYNVLMTAKQSRVKDDFTGITNFVPMLPGRQLTQQIPYLFDEVFVLRVEKNAETGEMFRVIQTDDDISYNCKDRSGKLDMFEPADIAHIAAKIRGGPGTAPEVPAAAPPPADVNEEPEEKSEETD